MIAQVAQSGEPLATTWFYAAEGSITSVCAPMDCQSLGRVETLLTSNDIAQISSMVPARRGRNSFVLLIYMQMWL